MIFLRSLVFNILFFGFTAMMAICAIPALFMGRSACVWVAKFWMGYVYLIERFVIGLNYRVIGKDNLPEDGSYIIACKHQSAWETMKLIPVFGEVLIVLKKELMDLPLWGGFAKKYGVIPVDRSKGREATKYMLARAKESIQTGRPIAIFPQGTRVRPDQTSDDKPYKWGMIKLYEALNIPVVPVSLNSGFFWPRLSFIKKPGTITIEIHPPIQAGKNPKETHQLIEKTVETRTNELVAQAQNDYYKKTSMSFSKIFASVIAVTVIIFSSYWYAASQIIRSSVNKQITTIQNSNTQNASYKTIKVSGYPFTFDMTIKGLHFADKSKGVITVIPDINIKASALNWSSTIRVQMNNGLSSLQNIKGKDFMIQVRSIGALVSPYDNGANISGFIDGITVISDDIPSKFQDFTTIKNIDFDLSMRPMIKTLSKDHLKKWKNANGQVNINTLDIDFDIFKAGIVGALTLDNNLQPEFSGHIKSKGIDKIINLVMENTKNKTSQKMGLLQGVMNGFGLNLNTIGSSQNNMPLSIKNKYLFIGPLPLFKTPSLKWGK